jgi:outer membrane protein assembly factor BamB
MTMKTTKIPTRNVASPKLLPAVDDWNPAKQLKIANSGNPLPRGTLGDIGVATRVSGANEFPPTLLIQPINERGAIGIDASSLRVFRWDERQKVLRPVWNSGINLPFAFVWAEITKPGIYLPIGLPRDRLLQELLRQLALERRYADAETQSAAQKLTREMLGPIVEVPPEEVEELRQLLALVEVQTTATKATAAEVRRGGGAGILAFPLPQDKALEDFRKRLDNLQTPLGGLPEEALFFRPELSEDREPPWPLPPIGEKFPWPGLDRYLLDRISWKWIVRFPICWLFSRDWWMYHHDENLTGRASGCSGINRTTAGGLTLRSTLALDGPVISIPAIVDAKIYVGTGNSSTARSASGGTLYKIDLATGAIDRTFTFDTLPGTGSRQGYAGIGGSPAVVGGKVYFSGLDGRVYCLDANTFSVLWITNLRNTDLPNNQPVNHTANAEGWSSPLVVNGRVYVGFGEGESNTFGFVYCLDANNGHVLWLFCTNLFSGVADNSPNVIPSSLVSTPLPAGFSSAPNPPQRGASPWSSCAYDRGLNRVYIGTGNAIPDNPLPDPKYSSGVLSLDATTGAFRGFFQPSLADSYRPTDDDVDVPAGPMLYTRSGTRVLAIGSKNGSFFLLDPNTMTALTRRQLLPKDSAGNPLPNVDPGAGENRFGVFGTAALHSGLGRLFVGLGGYSCGIDYQTTPFLRALDWTTLADAWSTAGTNPPKYTVPVPPMYLTACEAGMSSPAVVNDVVFVCTTKPGLYALSAATGLCLWSAGTLASGYPMGPAIYGKYVAVGSGNNLYVYSL